MILLASLYFGAGALTAAIEMFFNNRRDAVGGIKWNEIGAFSLMVVFWPIILWDSL